mgnify:CR=1 FL=1
MKAKCLIDILEAKEYIRVETEEECGCPIIHISTKFDKVYQKVFDVCKDDMNVYIVRVHTKSMDICFGDVAYEYITKHGTVGNRTVKINGLDKINNFVYPTHKVVPLDEHFHKVVDLEKEMEKIEEQRKETEFEEEVNRFIDSLP